MGREAEVCQERAGENDLPAGAHGYFRYIDQMTPVQADKAIDVRSSCGSYHGGVFQLCIPRRQRYLTFRCLYCLKRDGPQKVVKRI